MQLVAFFVFFLTLFFALRPNSLNDRQGLLELSNEINNLLLSYLYRPSNESLFQKSVHNLVDFITHFRTKGL